MQFNASGAAGIRSLVVSIFALGVTEVLVVGHRDCGMAHLNVDELERSMLDRGVPQDAILVMDNLHEWLGGFADPVTNVHDTVRRIRSNQLIPNDVPVHGLIMEPQQGVLTLLVDGYKWIETSAKSLD